LIYNKNSNGPKIEPCGTPHLIKCSDETKLSILDTFGVDLKDMILTSQELDLVFHKIPAFSVECHG
jgi:hypothetical protein